MNVQHPGWLPVAGLAGLLLLSGCGPLEEGPKTNSGDQQPAIDAYDRGMDHAKKGEFDKAIAEFTEAIRLDPEYTAAYCDRGFTYDEKGDVDKAIADYTETIRLNPKYADAFYNRGVGYEDKGDKAKAEADFAKAKELGYEPE